MPTTYAIPDGRTVMAATTYTGNGGTLAVSNAVNGVSFQPDLVWIKMRSGAAGNELFDSIRGANIVLYSNASNAEANVGTMSTFGSGGFTAVYQAADVSTNNSGSTFVGWQWKAGGTAVSNTDGTITTTISASSSSGFSVITYTGTGIDNKTIGHGLGAAPKFLIWKPRASATDWMVWHTGLSGFNYDVRLNTTAAQGTGANPLNNTAPSSTVITLRNQGDVNGSGTTIVCYAFAAVAGYSAFGSYTGNGSTDGPFIYTGFRPRFVMIKRTDTTADWNVYDSSRASYNLYSNRLYANLSAAEDAVSTDMDLLSNGFKLRSTGSSANASGGTYMYACFAETAFKFSNAR